jgi:hypothetical protein
MASIDDLIRDINSEEFQHGVSQGFWEFQERSDWLLYVILRAPDDCEYLARLDCSSYGDEPILGQFVDLKTRQCIASAWPKGDSVFAQWVKFEPGNLFLCWDQDRAGIKHHPDWRERRAWTKKRNQLVAYLNFLRELLHLPRHGYQRQDQPTPNS